MRICDNSEHYYVKNVASVDSQSITDWQKLLTQFLVTNKDSSLTWHEKDKLLQLLLLNHDAFALVESERGNRLDTDAHRYQQFTI